MSLLPLRFKVVIVGDGCSGKTSLLCRFSTGVFPEIYIPTTVDNCIAELKVDQRNIELALWDTAGGDFEERLRPLAYPDTDVILIAFAANNPDSLDNVLDKWTEEIRHFLPKTPIILVCCKMDLRNDEQALAVLARDHQWSITSNEGTAVAAKIGATKYLECSAKTGEGVAELFETAARVCIDVQARNHKARRTRFHRPDTCIIC
ncbi:GTP-binding protein rho5 [Flagelloscypha sp. PMI_526]|nr:GTP-binding protein rho5 [Flagelloscypha sp. PMI_526]